ncbi:hypothetical protein CDL12_09462 [Handroanthus impetiginosus]|uniref:Uncharacterized protein n=1 Tax=Handroanthus impetiginosus TaxID=429701 RepID=A0A2G9HK40_9LAMI|nr:hypothetical protein CDL12_09462 [Handroanthus impetiginosus]
MPFNSVLVVSTAHISAELWQRVACLPERISSDQLLDLVLCFPLQQLGRWALDVWTYLCVSPYPLSYYSDDSDEESGDENSGGGNRNGRGYDYFSHSD